MIRCLAVLIGELCDADSKVSLDVFLCVGVRILGPCSFDLSATSQTNIPFMPFMLVMSSAADSQSYNETGLCY
jgi:hypothetical protein